MSNTKDRLLATGENLFRMQGYSGTGLKQLARKAKAPWSSMYHFFPGGKKQLATEVMDYAADQYGKLVDKAFLAFPDPVDAVAAMFSAEAKTLRSSNFQNGCPIASVTLDVASTVEPLRKSCSQAFDLWKAALVRGIVKSGAPRPLANRLASFVLSSLEGAIVLSRAKRSIEPLRQTGAVVCQALKDQLRDARGKRR